MVSRAFTAEFDWLYPLRVIVAGAFLWIYRRRYVDLRSTFSWAAVGMGVAAFALWMGIEALTSPEAVQFRPRGLPGNAPTGILLILWLCLRIAGSVITVPLAEELAFRGYLTRRLVTQEYWELPVGTFSWPSFLVSSAIFGLLHSHWIVGTLSGMVFALALYRRRQLADAVVAHATTNALIAMFVLSSGNWSLWT